MLALPRRNGSGVYGSGVGIADIDFCATVHPDQFWMSHTPGNVREHRCSEIWQDASGRLLAGLRDWAPQPTPGT